MTVESRTNNSKAGKVSGRGISNARVTRPSASSAGVQRILNTRPDGIDFRDKMYIPTLVEVPVRRDLKDYRKARVPILDQGQEGACTGFGLATVAQYLLATRKVDTDTVPVSPFMLYDMARRYDEWAGEDYEGSSCRGAIKGWYKHGVCKQKLWPASSKKIKALSEPVVADAVVRPLGAYFRVNHKDLVAMHAAITETRILYASATVHTGWEKVKGNGKIKYETTPLGGHAFAIVAYDKEGFWIQNSWGEDWGYEGFCHVTYQDWLENGADVWAVRLGAPILLARPTRSAGTNMIGAVRAGAFVYNDIRPHVISIKNDGQLDEHGDVGTSPEMVREILQKDFLRITAGWKKKRLVLYAHGGLVGEEAALQRIGDYRKASLEAECYPLAFIWKTDYWTTLRNMLRDATQRRRPEGFLDSTKDFMLDRLDDALEPIARLFTGKAEWSEMKENALLATTSVTGGARIVANEIAKLVKNNKDVELHIVGHSAGSILHAPLIQYLTEPGMISSGPMAVAKVKGLGMKIETCTLWAPACTTRLFKESYLPAINQGLISRFSLFTLTDKAEQDDNCANIYHKSLLYMVSNAFEETARIPIVRPDGEPILGMEKFVNGDSGINSIFKKKAGKKEADWVMSPNNEPMGSQGASKSMHHGDFDDDEATVKATLARILGKTSTEGEFSFKHSSSSRRGLRRQIDGERDATLTR
jgi:hypothetical protein